MTLQDAARVKLPGEGKQCFIALSELKFLQKRETFYSKFGFKPLLSESLRKDYMFKSRQDKSRKLCQWAKEIQGATIKEIVSYFDTLTQEFKKDKSPMAVVDIEHDDGLKATYADREPVTDKELKKYKAALKYFAKLPQTMRIAEFTRNIDCKGMDMLMVFLQHPPHEYHFENGVVVKNPYVTPLILLFNYLMNDDYILDLTEKVTPMCLGNLGSP